MSVKTETVPQTQPDQTIAGRDANRARADAISAPGVAFVAPAPAGKPREDSGERDPGTLDARRARSARVWAGLRRKPPRSRRALPVAGAALFIILLIAVVVSLRPKAAPTDCDSPFAPAANWDFCAKAGLYAVAADFSQGSARNATFIGARMERAKLVRADLSYAELSRADLSLSDLTAARMLGARLVQANLSHANFERADLRYTDLTGARLMGANFAGARLDHAIWSDGRICAANSVGACLAL